MNWKKISCKKNNKNHEYRSVEVHEKLSSKPSMMSTTPILNRHTRFPITAHKRRVLAYNKERQCHENTDNQHHGSASNESDNTYSDEETQITDVNKFRRNKGLYKQEMIEELFVSMIAFSKMGFEQPPCCLKCAYHTSTGDYNSTSSPILTCKNLILWKIDATKDAMKDNIVIVQCRAADMLIGGKEVESWKWDNNSKKLRSS